MFISDCLEHAKALRAERDRLSLLVQQVVAERLQHADAAVVGGRPADADDETAAASFDRVADHFPDAIGRRVHRISVLVGDKRDACGLRHLENRCAAVLQDAVLRVDHFTEGTCHADMCERSAHAERECLDRALAAVRERPDDDLCVLVRKQNACPDRVTCLERAERSFQRINGDNCLHRKPPLFLFAFDRFCTQAIQLQLFSIFGSIMSIQGYD